MNRWIPTAAAILVAVVFAVPAIRHWREQPPPPPPAPQPLRAAWAAPDGLDVGGRRGLLIWTVAGPGWPSAGLPRRQGRGGVAVVARLAERRVARWCQAPTARRMPFWSADGARIGFFANGQLRVVRSRQRPGRRSRRCVVRHAAATGTRAGDLVFAPSPNAGLMKRDANGSIAALTTLDPASGETSHAWPSFLPDGKHVIFLVSASQPSRAGIWIASLDDPSHDAGWSPRTRRRSSSDQTLLYPSRSRLVAQPLDPVTFEPAGRSDRRRPECGTRSARTDLRDGVRRRADLRRAGHRAARAAMGVARRAAGRIDERADRRVGPAHRAGRQAHRRRRKSIDSCERSTSSSAPDRSRRRRDCRCRPTSTRAACGRRMACGSRGPASGAR